MHACSQDTKSVGPPSGMTTPASEAVSTDHMAADLTDHRLLRPSEHVARPRAQLQAFPLLPPRCPHVEAVASLTPDPRPCCCLPIPVPRAFLGQKRASKPP